MDQTWVRELHVTSDTVFAISWRAPHKAALSGSSCTDEVCAPRGHGAHPEGIATDTGEHFTEAF